MTQNRMIWRLFALWLIAAGWSIWALLGMESTGDGFGRGWNKVMWFLAAQVAAAVVALMLAIMGWSATGPSRVAARGPIFLSGATVLGIGGLIAHAIFSMPDPPDYTDRPVTAPAAVAEPD
ncbi:MAG: hypothetical protein AB3N23_14960 [Paracoccaceae bacterium]